MFEQKHTKQNEKPVLKQAYQAITRQGVRATLQHHGVGLKVLHDFGDDGSENGPEAVVSDAVTQREVDGVVAAFFVAQVPPVTSARKVLPELVETARHDAVGGVKSLLHTVAVVNVNVDVQDALVHPATKKKAHATEAS